MSSQGTRHDIFQISEPTESTTLISRIEKTFVPREGMKLEVRGEFFNFFNTPRFAVPDTLWGDSTFGQILDCHGQHAAPRATRSAF